MKSYREEQHSRSPRAADSETSPAQVAEDVRKSAIREGLCLVNSMHITASVFFNDDERGVRPAL
jgi:thiamine phosphate synthase YjbQ (UPF0047 family)